MALEFAFVNIAVNLAHLGLRRLEVIDGTSKNYDRMKLLFSDC